MVQMALFPITGLGGFQSSYRKKKNNALGFQLHKAAKWLACGILLSNGYKTIHTPTHRHTHTHTNTLANIFILLGFFH